MESAARSVSVSREGSLQLFVKHHRVAGTAVRVERVVGNYADAVPAGVRIQLLGRVATHRIERQQGESRMFRA